MGQEVSAFIVVRAVPEGGLWSCYTPLAGIHRAKIDLISFIVNAVGKTINLRQPRHVISNLVMRLYSLIRGLSTKERHYTLSRLENYLGENANWTRGCSRIRLQIRAIGMEVRVRLSMQRWGGEAEAEGRSLEFSSRVDILLQQSNLLFCRSCLRCKTD